MAVAQPRTDFGSWSADGHAIRIEYALPVLEDICSDAIDGLYQFRHGGVEVGGVFYGEADGDLIRILAYRPLACEHAFGPRFVLSERDRARMKELLYAPKHDAALNGLEPVGWYHSHTRSGIELSPRDLEIYDSYFPQRWQVALVLRPDHYGPARAGFFFREAGGSIQTGAAYTEFTIQKQRRGVARVAPGPASPRAEAQPAAEALAGTAEQSPVPAAPSAEPASSAAPRWILDEQTPETRPVEDGPAVPAFLQQQPHRSHRWLWTLVLFAFASAGAVGVEEYWRRSRPQPPLALWVADMGGQLLIEWDRTARPIRDAQSATLHIMDGKEPVEIQIDGDRLREGSVDYVRRSDVVDVRLRVRQSGGTAEEYIRFVGQPVRRSQSPEEGELLRQQEALKAEVADLRAQLRAKDEQLRRVRGPARTAQRP